jgi:hypothetical protein
MPTDARTTAPARPDRSALEAAVLQAGALLGWRGGAVAAFAEALTGCPWPRCGPAELRLVLDEYRALLAAAAAKLARRRAAHPGRRQTRAHHR